MRPERPLDLAAAVIATGATMLVLDLLWLGVVGRDIYRSGLGALMRAEVYWPAALAFYAMYVAAIVAHAVRGASSVASAAGRGAWMGGFAYATYELTNWAVISDWPAFLVPVDIAWGIALTALAAAAGKLADQRV